MSWCKSLSELWHVHMVRYGPWKRLTAEQTRQDDFMWSYQPTLGCHQGTGIGRAPVWCFPSLPTHHGSACSISFKHTIHTHTHTHSDKASSASTAPHLNNYFLTFNVLGALPKLSHTKPLLQKISQYPTWLHMQQFYLSLIQYIPLSTQTMIYYFSNRKLQ